ncbi:MAG: alpha/beta hydrolase [Acidimicrobiales bacterium]|nr:alpha/beta hydrolase [Acidimicrobiales bacterium]
MPRAHNGSVELEYEAFGSTDDPTLICLPGLGNQLLLFPVEFCESFVGRGFHVIRMDNRDAGLSSLTEPGDEYTLSDMAADVIAVLDDAGVDDAVVLGVSLGGMIAQTTAIEHPARVRALVSIMSTTGEPDVGTPSREAMAALVAEPAASIDEQIAQDLEARAIWSNPEWFDPEQMAAYFRSCYERSWVPGGSGRQFDAVMRSGDRAAGLAALTVPALVAHGEQDTLVHVSGGERTAELVPDAEFLLVDGMRHDFVYQAWPPIIEATTALTARTFA